MSGLWSTMASSTAGATVIRSAARDVVIRKTINRMGHSSNSSTEERAMQVVSITGERRCELVERPEPTVAASFAKVKILASPMCTEVANYCRGDRTDCLGHEAAGRGGKVVLHPWD